LRVAAFYHVWADGAWREPLAEFLESLDNSGFDGVFAIGLVGTPANRRQVTDLLADRWAPEVVAEAPDGFEKPTLDAVLAYARFYDGAVLYAHTKGAAENTEFRARWRRSMTRRVVDDWRDNLRLLEEHDAVGCHWLTEAVFPGMFGPMTIPTEGSGFFGGNFWMARCDYLRILPACEPVPRWKAESWIGIGKPRVVDLLPGWPHDNRWPELCA
jgi:hypothetical protein